MAGTWWKEPSELIVEQINILDLPLDKSILIKGPPGSGKTNLLLLRANHMYIADQPNIHVVVFGAVLRNFIRLGGDIYKFPSDKVVTHTRLFNGLMGEFGADPIDDDLSFSDARKARLQALQGLNDASQLGVNYQALLLDEAQDYLSSEIKILRSLAPVLIATCDAKQKIYDGDDCIKELEASVDECRELKYHFRNGRQICKVADGIMNGKPDYQPMLNNCQYNEAEYPSRVTQKKGLTIQQQAQAIAEQLAAQRDAYPEEVLGVMCPRKDELGIVWEELSKTSLVGEITKCRDADFDPSKKIWLSTISSAKGLEFRAAHLAGLDFLSTMGPAQKRLAFTAVTRAKTALTIYYQTKIPGYLDSAIRPLDPQVKPVSRAMIFGKE